MDRCSRLGPFGKGTYRKHLDYPLGDTPTTIVSRVLVLSINLTNLNPQDSAGILKCVNLSPFHF